MFKRLRIILVLLLPASGIWAQGQTLELKDLFRDQIKSGGFILNQDKDVHIKAIGAGGDRWLRKLSNHHEDKHNLFVYAWIIDARTRDMVWRMTVDNTKPSRWSDWNRTFDDEVHLKKGRYEAYISAVEPSFYGFDGGFLTLGKLLKKLFSDSDEWDRQAAEWMFSISGIDEALSDVDIRKQQSILKDKAIVELTGLRDSDRESKGFTLLQPLDISVYALGEGFEGKMYDFGWIINADTRKKVWLMRDRYSDYAGGAQKNKVVREDLSLKPGDYLVYYQLDDSHSSEKWNANPPYDPAFWGITIFPKSEDFNPSMIKKYSEKKLKPVISITRVGDYAYKEEAMELEKECNLRIVALGEGRDGEMFDYGWISREDDGRIVWKMRYRDTKHAGGASKNRLFDDVIHLKQGKYIVHYQTDDSHSYEDWNMRRPQNPEMWGITIYPTKDNAKVKHIEKSTITQKNIIAQLVRIGDDERVRKQFYIDKPTRIRVYCIGEGDWDEMYDYGWIENVDRDRVVWKMTYRKTEHAGGAKKNRKVDTIITLDAGTYRVYYQSDDSHSYYHWNDDPPYDERNWGITVYLLQD